MKTFAERLPYASDLALDLLKKMVSFNPYMRPKVEECLEHPFFVKLRQPAFETSSPRVINLVELDAESAP